MGIPYRKIPGKIVAGAALAALIGAGAAQLAAEWVAGFEGYVPRAYVCPAGVRTKCFGDTKDVETGRVYTFEECLESLNAHLAELTAPLLACVPELSKAPDRVKAASASMAYNIGPGAFCRSSVALLFRAGEWEAGCARMAHIYRSANGETLAGLVSRRERESALCLEGLREAK